MAVHDIVTQKEEKTQGLLQVRWDASPAPIVDEAGGKTRFDVGVTDVDASADIPSADIDITAATVTLQKSAAGGAYATTGITQPSLSKAAGLVFVDYDFIASEWAAGDKYRLLLTGVKVKDSDGRTYRLPPIAWSNVLLEVGDLQGKVTTLHDARLTAARAVALDEVTAARLSELDAATAGKMANEIDVIKAFVDELEIRLTALRAGYLDNLSGGAVALQSSVDDLEGRLTAARAALLDEITAARLSELDGTAGKMAAEVDLIKTRVTGTRTTGTHTQNSGSTAKQTVVEVPGITVPEEVVLLLDLNALTQHADVFLEIQVDGATYREVKPKEAWLTTDPKAVLVTFTSPGRPWKVSLASTVNEAANRSVPFVYSRRPLG